MNQQVKAESEKLIREAKALRGEAIAFYSRNPSIVRNIADTLQEYGATFEELTPRKIVELLELISVSAENDEDSQAVADFLDYLLRAYTDIKESLEVFCNPAEVQGNLRS